MRKTPVRKYIKKTPVKKLKAPNDSNICIQLSEEMNCKKPYCQVFNCKDGYNLDDYTNYIKTVVPCKKDTQLYCEMDNNSSKVYCKCSNIKAIDKKCRDGYEMYTVRGGCERIRTNQVCPAILVTHYYCRKKTDEPICVEQQSEDDNCVSPYCKMMKCKIGSSHKDYKQIISCDENTEELICHSKKDKIYCKCILNKARMTDFGDGKPSKPSCQPGWKMYDSLLLDGDCSFEVFPTSECTPKMYKLCKKV